MGYSLMEIIWTADQYPNEIFDIEIRQDCYEIIDALVNGRAHSSNVILINNVRKLWRNAAEKVNVRHMNLYHIYAHGRGETSDPWKDLAGTVAKKVVGGFAL